MEDNHLGRRRGGREGERGKPLLLSPFLALFFLPPREQPRSEDPSHFFLPAKRKKKKNALGYIRDRASLEPTHHSICVRQRSKNGGGEGGGGSGLLLGAICLVGKYMWDEEKSRSDQRKRGEIGEKDLDLI